METKSETANRIIGPKQEETNISIPIQEDIASKISGHYTGNGESPAGTAFVNKIIKISKKDKARIKIEPVGHTDITAFEINIIQIGSDIIQNATEANYFEIQTGTSPAIIRFETYIPDQTFEGYDNR